MFANACSIARKFTSPVIISHRTASSECGSGIGTFVVINDEGWCLTAFHIIAQINQLGVSNNEYKTLLAKRAEIESKEDIKKHIKMQQLNNHKILPNAITNFSIWLGWDGVSIGELFVIPEADIAVFKLVNFKKEMVSEYPKFKNPDEPMEQGTSLCKLGFPFHSIKPTFDETTKSFILPDNSLPIPIFPIEGIYTRTVNLQGNETRPYPLMYIETSSPGLRGQSGGPTFDINGAIWAIQSQTQHLHLGFGENQKHSKEAEHLKNQYLNVGWGTHSSTITNLLKEKNIPFHYF
jgi:hypothetical protein